MIADPEPCGCTWGATCPPLKACAICGGSGIRPDRVDWLDGLIVHLGLGRRFARRLTLVLDLVELELPVPDSVIEEVASKSRLSLTLAWAREGRRLELVVRRDGSISFRSHANTCRPPFALAAEARHGVQELRRQIEWALAGSVGAAG